MLKTLGIYTGEGDNDVKANFLVSWGELGFKVGQLNEFIKIFEAAAVKA